MENQIPNGWVKCKLGDVAIVKNGFAFKSSEFSNFGIPVIRISDINESLVSAEKAVRITEKEQFNNFRIQKGDILIAMSGATTGKFGVYQEIGIAYQNQRVGNILPLSTEINKSFLFYYIFNAKKQIEKDAYGGAQPNISSAKVEQLNFLLPPLNEQRRIVAKIETLFSELDDGIASLKTAKEQLKVYRQAVLKHAFEGKLTAKWRAQNADKLETPEQLLARIQTERETRYQQQLEEWKEAVKQWETNGKRGKKPSKPKAFKPMAPISNDEIGGLPDLPVGWVYARLAEISLIGSGMSVSKDRKLSEPVEVPYLRVANVQRGNLLLDEIKTMQVEKNSLAELTLEKWDVLFNEGGDRDKLGRGWVWEGQIESCITQNHVFRASPIIKSEYHSKFVSHWGNSFGRDYFEKGGKQTTNLASINKTVLSNFPVPVPSMEEQQQLIIMLDDVMSQIDAMETEIENGIQRAETLRQSILKKAFSGQLVPQDPNDEPASELLSRIQDKKFNQKTKHVRQING